MNNSNDKKAAYLRLCQSLEDINHLLEIAKEKKHSGKIVTDLRNRYNYISEALQAFAIKDRFSALKWKTEFKKNK